MYQNYSPVLILTIFAVILIALPLVIQYLISPRDNKGGEKLIPYECGEVPEGSAWVKFNIRFYIIALIFIIFDGLSFIRFKQKMGDNFPEVVPL